MFVTSLCGEVIVVTRSCSSMRKTFPARVVTMSAPPCQRSRYGSTGSVAILRVVGVVAEPSYIQTPPSAVTYANLRPLDDSQRDGAGCAAMSVVSKLCVSVHRMRPSQPPEQTLVPSQATLNESSRCAWSFRL